MDTLSFYVVLLQKAFTKNCPRNKLYWETASRRLGCSNDLGSYVYHCLQIENYSLVEVCLYPLAARQNGMLSCLELFTFQINSVPSICKEFRFEGGPLTCLDPPCMNLFLGVSGKSYKGP